MKYILIIAIVILIVRIDYVLLLLDRTVDQFRNKPVSQVIPTDIVSSQIIPIADDLAIRTSPKNIFLSILKDFALSPQSELKNRAIEHLAAHQDMFTNKLDPDLAAVFFRFEETLKNKNVETARFLVELIDALKEENSMAARNTLSIFIDVDFVEFLKIYKTPKDATCAIATFQPEQLPTQEKIYELAERLELVDEYLADEKADLVLKQLAANCQLRLRLKLDELKTSLLPEPATEASPEAVIEGQVP